MACPPAEFSVMPRMQPMANSALEQAGWVLVATRGSHRQFKHPGADQQPHGMSR